MTDQHRSIYENVARLARMVREFERRVFGDDLSQTQKDILLACVNLASSNPKGMVYSEELKTSPFCASISQPTYNRALRQLVIEGYIQKSPRKTGEYSLGELRPVAPEESFDVEPQVDPQLQAALGM